MQFFKFTARFFDESQSKDRYSKDTSSKRNRWDIEAEGGTEALNETKTEALNETKTDPLNETEPVKNEEPSDPLDEQEQFE